MRILPRPDETPLEALIRTHAAQTAKMFEWNEEDFAPATDEEMRAGIREAMTKFADLLPPPEADTCECLTCRSFRTWLSKDDE